MFLDSGYSGVMNKTLNPDLQNSRRYPAHWIRSDNRVGYLQIVETDGKEHAMITDLIVRLSLRGSFNLIAVDEWLPDRDTLYRSVRRYTLKVKEAMDRPRIKRPMTCLQLKDLLMETDLQNKPTLIVNYFYHFYNADVELSLRERVLKQCCQYTKSLSLCDPVIVIAPRLSRAEYTRFFPVLASVADEIIPIAEWSVIGVSQGSLF